MQITIGRTVIYKITDQQANEINRRRTNGGDIAARIKQNTDSTSMWPIGAQAHIGNSTFGGEEFPLVVVRVWPNEFGEGKSGVNGQLMLDGNDSLWVTSAGEGIENGQWHWPEIVK